MLNAIWLTNERSFWVVVGLTVGFDDCLLPANYQWTLVERSFILLILHS